MPQTFSNTLFHLNRAWMDVPNFPSLEEIEWFNNRTLEAEHYIANNDSLIEADIRTDGKFREAFLRMCIDFEGDLRDLTVLINESGREKGKQSFTTLSTADPATFSFQAINQTMPPTTSMQYTAPQAVSMSTAAAAVQQAPPVPQVLAVTRAVHMKMSARMEASSVSAADVAVDNNVQVDPPMEVRPEEVLQPPPAPPPKPEPAVVKEVEANNPDEPVASNSNSELSSASVFTTFVPQRVVDIAGGGAIAALGQGAIAAVNNFTDERIDRSTAIKNTTQSACKGFVDGVEITAVITAGNFVEGALIAIALETGKAFYYDGSQVAKGEMTVAQFLRQLMATRGDTILAMGALAFFAGKFGRSTPLVSTVLCAVELIKLFHKWCNGELTSREMVVMSPQVVGAYGAGAAGAIAGAAWGFSVGGVAGGIAASVLFGLFGSLTGSFIGKNLGAFLADLFNLEDPIGAAYRILNVSKNCTDGELRRAYYRIMREAHPDKRPREEEAHWRRVCQNVSAAKELLDTYRRTS